MVVNVQNIVWGTLALLVVVSAGRPVVGDEGNESATYKVSGKVVDGAEHALAGIDIQLETNDSALNAVTDAQGRFSIALPQTQDLRRATLTASDKKGDLLGYHAFTRVREGEFEPVEIVLKPARKVRFNVLNASDEPLANVLVAGV